jgi:tetratricopeptide (TPR) repeat protein
MSLTMPGNIDYTRVCFVVMPFGKKPVGTREVDFNYIYDHVFKPAVTQTPLPAGENGYLEVHRTDKDFFSGNISTEMFHYLEYSRMVLADISGLNANVFYELGQRHRARETGTVILRQTDAPIPFDINTIKAFPYDYEPEDHAAESRALITRVLKESLEQNRIDSPVQSALQVQRQHHQNVEALLMEAENAIRNDDRATAMAKYKQAAAISFANPLIRLKLGLLFKDDGKWKAALDEFITAVQYSPDYAEAWREKGIAENKLYTKAPDKEGIPDGEASLRKALELNQSDFDGWSSLGGVLKRRKDWAGALDAYRHATDVSNGHPYPLLNELTIDAHINGQIDPSRRSMFLKRAERALMVQTKNNPPYGVPWSFFDLAQTKLLRGDGDGFVQTLEDGLIYATASWQPETFLNTLRLLPQQDAFPRLGDGVRLLEEAMGQLPS